MLRRTPCIGICSTTYGDLVCRGCKRFAHEIVGWNTYEQAQRDVVWARLLSLRAGATGHLVEIVETTVLFAASPPPDAAEADPYLVAYEAIRRHAGTRKPAVPLLGRLGLRLRDPGFIGAVEDLLMRIDQEFYQRSLAQYERNFRTSAR
jgi:hypothetical protein